MTGSGMTAVERAELRTTDMDQLASMFRQQFVGHAAAFRCADPSMVTGRVRTAAAGGLAAGMLGYDGFAYTAQLEPLPEPMAVTVLRGAGSVTTRQHEQYFAAGDVIMMPADQPSVGATTTGIRYTTLQVPWAAVRGLAEEGTGDSAGSLRFESAAPVSTAHQRAFARTVAYICDRLLISGITEEHPLLVEAMTGLAAAAMLETFPNTTMTVAHLPGPGWVPPASVRRAAEFIEEHADQPVTVAQIAAAADLTPRALRHVFRTRFDITLAQYQRQVRLERAHTELLHADSRDGVTVAGVARKWGWASPSQFTAAYRQRFRMKPSHTLHI